MRPSREASVSDRIPAAVTDTFLRRPVAVAHPSEAATVQPGATARQIIEVMRQRGCREVVVCSPFSGRPVGIITQRELSRDEGVVDADFAERTAREIMTPKPFCLDPKASIGMAMNKMAMEGWDGIPIVDESGRLSGIITITHLMRFLFCLSHWTANPSKRVSISNAQAGQTVEGPGAASS